jgi:hypothetical protein
LYRSGAIEVKDFPTPCAHGPPAIFCTDADSQQLQVICPESRPEEASGSRDAVRLMPAPGSGTRTVHVMPLSGSGTDAVHLMSMSGSAGSETDPVSLMSTSETTC